MKTLKRITLVTAVLALAGAGGFLLFRNDDITTTGPRLPEGVVAPKLVSTWTGQAYMVTPDGELWKWGTERRYLPNQNVTNSETPIRFGIGADWKSVDAKSSHGLALKQDGTLWAWGVNVSRLKTADAPGFVGQPSRVGSSADWVAISVGETHCLALKRDGTLWSWGRSDRGQLGHGAKFDSAFFNRQVAESETTTFDENGAPNWPFEPGFEPRQVTEATDWKSISAGSWNSYALKDDGTLWRWGMDPAGGQGTNDITAPALVNHDTDWQSISAGGFHLVALKSDGTLWLTGQNAHVVAGSYATGSEAGMIRIGEDDDWREVVSGVNGFLARKADHSWWVCGNNSFGQLGLGSITPNTQEMMGSVGVPTSLPFDLEPWALAMGVETTLVLTHDGILWSWGQRSGAPKPVHRFVKAKQAMNKAAARPSLDEPLFKFEDTVIDLKPRRIWKYVPKQK